jgi:CheY-like chemotaxis protein
MIVDDYSQNAVLLSYFLSRQGYATNGREAMQLLERERSDLILSDVSMPEMDGYELLEYVRLNFASTRVILMSGDFVLARTLSGCRAPDALLIKPFDPKKLLETIQSALDPQAAPAFATVVTALRGGAMRSAS